MMRTPAPFSREGVRKRLEEGSGYDDVLITEDYTKLKDFALEQNFITKQEAQQIATLKADRVAALIAEGKGGQFAGREYRPDLSQQQALAKRQEIGAGYAAQAPIERQKDIELLGKMGYTPEDVAKFGADRSGFIPEGVPIFGGNEVPILSKSFWQDPARNLGISAYQGGVGLGATAEGMVAPARALATRFTGGDPTQFYAPNDNPLIESGTIFGSNAAESAAGFPARYAGMRTGGQLGFRAGMAMSGGNPLWGAVGAVGGGMLGQLGMGYAMDTLNDAAMNVILGRDNAARLKQRKQELSEQYPLASRIGEELPDLTMFGPSFKVKGWSGKAARQGFKQAGIKGLRQGVVDQTEFAGDLAERGGESALNMVLAYKQSQDEKKLGMPGKSAWDILAEGALGAVMQGDTRFGRAVYGGLNKLTDPGMIQQAINRTAPGMMPGAGAMPMSPAGDTGSPMRPGMRRFNLGGRIESGVDEDGSPIIKGARYAVYDPETRKAQVYTDNDFALEGARTRKAAQSLQGTHNIFKRQPVIQYNDSVVGGQRQILGITRDAGVLVRDYTNDGKSTISAVPLSEIRNAKISKRINEVIENQGVRPNSRPAPFMPEAFTNFNPVAFPDTVSLTTDSEPIPARVVERIGGKTDASYIVALPDGTHFRAHESQINVDKFTGGEHIIRGAMKDTDFPRSLADLAPKRGGLDGLVRIGEGSDAPFVELTPTQRKDYQAVATKYQADIDAIKREPDKTRRSQMLDIVQGKIANEYLATNPIAPPSGTWREGDVVDVNLSQTKFAGKPQTAIVTDVNDYGYAVRLVDHPNVGTFTVQDANVMGEAVPDVPTAGTNKGVKSLAAGRISTERSTATGRDGVPAVTRGYASTGMAATDVATVSDKAKHVDYVELPEDVQQSIQKRFKKAVDDGEITAGNSIDFIESTKDGQVHGQIHVHALDNMTFQVVATNFPEGGGAIKDQYVSSYNVRYNPETDMWDVYSVDPETARRMSESDEAAYMAISHLKNVAPVGANLNVWNTKGVTKQTQRNILNTFLDAVNVKFPINEKWKTASDFDLLLDNNKHRLANGEYITPFSVDSFSPRHYYKDVWTNESLDMSDPAQYARASDAARDIYDALNGSAYRKQDVEDLIRNRREESLGRLEDQLNNHVATNNWTEVEHQLFMMMASKYALKTEKDANQNIVIKLVDISKNNEVLPVSYSQVDYDAFVDALRAGEIPKKAFLTSLESAQRNNVSNRSVPVNGWKKYPQSSSPTNAAELSRDVADTVWCIASTDMARHYMEQADFYVYFEDSRPLVAYCGNQHSIPEPPRGTRDNSQAVNAYEQQLAVQHMKDNGIAPHYLDDVNANKSANNIAQGIGTAEDVDNVNKLKKSARLYSNRDNNAEVILHKLKSPITFGYDWTSVRFANTYNRYGGKKTQLELLTDLPDFRKNYELLVAGPTNQMSFTINDVDSLYVQGDQGIAALKEIYNSHIKGKNIKHEITIQIEGTAHYDRYGSTIAQNISGDDWDEADIERIWRNDVKGAIKASDFDNDFSWAYFSADRAPLIHIDGADSQTIKMNRASTYALANSIRNATIEVQPSIDPSKDGVKVDVHVVSRLDSDIVNIKALEQTDTDYEVSSYNGTLNVSNMGIRTFNFVHGDITLTDSVLDSTYINDTRRSSGVLNIVNTKARPQEIYRVRLQNPYTALNYYNQNDSSPLTIYNVDAKLHQLYNTAITQYFYSDYELDVDTNIKRLFLSRSRHKVNINSGSNVDVIDFSVPDGDYEVNSPNNNSYITIQNDKTDWLTAEGKLIVNFTGKDNAVMLKGTSGNQYQSVEINSPQQTTLVQSFTNGRNSIWNNITSNQFFDRFFINGDYQIVDEYTQRTFSEAIKDLVKFKHASLSVNEYLTIKAIRQAIIANFPGVTRKANKVVNTSLDECNTNLIEHDLSKISIGDFNSAEIEAILTTELHQGTIMNMKSVARAILVNPDNQYSLQPLNHPAYINMELAQRAAIDSSLAEQNGHTNVKPPSSDIFPQEPDVYTFDGAAPTDVQILPPDGGDEAAYQEIDDAGTTPSKTPKKVGSGYKLQGSFRMSVPTSQLRRYREEVNKLAIQHGVDSEAYRKGMKKLEKEYRELISQASAQVLAIINKIATEQRPNVTGYQQKDTTAARIGYAIKSVDRNFNNLPKPSGDTPDNRLGTYKMMFNALGEDYSVDAFRVSNRAQLKTVLQKQYKYDATNSDRIAEVVDRFARAWAMGKIQSQGFRPTEIVEITGKLAENLFETGAYTTPSSDMLFQYFPGGSKAETKLVAQYMREFYEDRFAAFGVLDDAYDFTKKFRGAIFRTNKAKDDAVLNVIVGFASRDETTGIHEIAHALFRGMGYPFQKAIAEAMGVNSMTLKAMAKDGKFPIWVEEKWAAAFEGSLRAGVAPQAKDATDPTRPRQQDPTLAKLWMELGDFLTGARNATIKKKIASGEDPHWGLNEKGTEWIARFKPTDKLYSGNELELTDGSLVSVVSTQTAAGEPVRVVDIDSGKVSTVSVDEIKRYAGRVPSGFNKATLDTLSTWLRSYYGNTERNIRTTLPDMVADYSGGEVDLGQLRAESTKLQKVAFQEAMDEPRSPLLSSLSKMSSVQTGIKSLLANNRLEIGNKGTVKNAYDRYGKPSNSFRLLRDVYGFDGNTAAAYYAQTETPEFKKWSENLPLLEAVNSIQVSPDIDMNKMSPEERSNYRRYETGHELANLASEILRDGADDNDVDKFVDLADQYYRNDGRSLKEIRKAVEQIVNANEDENVQQLMSFETSLRRELETSADFEQAREVSVSSDVYRNAAHTPRTGKGFVTVSFPAMESSNLIRTKNGVVLTSGITSFDGNRQGGEYIKFKNPQVVNLEGQGIDQKKLDRIIANATKAKRDGVVLLNLRHSNTVNSALHNVAVPITRYPTKSIVAVPGVDLGTYFSGGGTLEASVYESVFPKIAVEYNAEIASVYRANHGDHVQVKDVQEVDPTSLKDVQWFHASPVCKNFSDANPNAIETILDKKTGKAVVDAIDHSRPPIVTIENVAKYRESESFTAILDALRRNGYEFDYGVYKTSKYGGGTSRQRLIVRAVRGFALPPIIKTDASQRTWYESIKDIIDTLPISELAPNQLRKLEASKIDVRAMKTPVLFTQNSYHAVGITADKVFPSFTTSGGTYRILMPGGQVRAITGVAFRRMMGLPDAYLLPESEPLARKILANGVPAELSQVIMAPLADAYARHNMRRLVQEEMRRMDTGEQAAYQEVDDEPRKTVYIMRGVSGSGKSTLANKLVGKTGRIFSTDNYFVNAETGQYKFDPTKISENHSKNLNAFVTQLENSEGTQTPLIVDNTNMQQWEYAPYVEAARKYGWDVEFAEIDPRKYTDADIKQLAKRNKHGVSEDVIRQMISRYEPRDTGGDVAYQEDGTNRRVSNAAMLSYVAQTANISESDVQKLIDNGSLPKPIDGYYDPITFRALQARVSVAVRTGKDGKLNWDNAVKFVPIIRDLNKKQIPFDTDGALEFSELVHWLKTRKGELFPMPNIRGEKITVERMIRTFTNSNVAPSEYVVGGDRSGLMYDPRILSALETYTNMRHNGYAVEFIKGVLNPEGEQRTLEGGVGVKEFLEILNSGRDKPITQDIITNWRVKGGYIPAMLNDPAHGVGKLFTPDHLLIAEKIADLIDSGVSQSVTKGQLKARLIADPEYVEAFTRIVTHPWYQSTSTTTMASIKEAKPIMRMADVIAAIAKEVEPNKFTVANYQALERSGNIPKGLKPSDGTTRRQYNDDYVKLAVMALNPKYRGKTAEFRKQDPEYLKLWNKINDAVRNSESGSEEAAYQEADDLFPSQRRTVETSDMPGAPMYVERIRPKQLPPRNAWFWGAIDLYNDITRLPLSGDLAFQNLQGGIIGLSNPLVGLKAFKAGLQGFAPNMQIEVNGQLYGSRKFGRETYHAAGEAMRRNPMYKLAKEAGLPLAMFEIDARLQEAREIELHNLKMTNPNATMKDVKIGLMDIDELGTVDEWYSKNRITRHLPMQGQFERFNSLVHDTLLLTQFDNWVKVLMSKGYQPNTAMFNKALKDAARVLAVSVGDIKYSTNPENDAAASRIAKIFFTAPRWLMSRALIDPFINQMVSNSSIFARLREIMGEDNPAFNLYNGDKEVAKLGQSMWLRIAGLEAMLAIMAWVFSNWYPDTEVNTDIQPGRIRIGDFQLDPMAGLIDHYKLAGRLAKAVFSVDPRDASRAEKEGIPQWMMAVKDISKELSYKASPGITFLQAISGTNDLKAQADNFFTAPWEAKAINVVGEPLFERSASAKIFYDMIKPRLRELFGDAVADDIPISNMMMDRIPMALPGFIDSFASAKEYNRDPWVYALADTIPNFFGFKVDVMPTEARKDRAKNKNMSTAEDSPTLLRLLAEGRASEAFTGTVKASPPSGNVNPW